MALKGSGGRWEGSEADADGDLGSGQVGLGSIEVGCFCVIIYVLHWLVTNILVHKAPHVFHDVPPQQHLFACLFFSLLGYTLAMSRVNVALNVRIAGAMLASVVSVALLYVMRLLDQSLYVSGFVMTVGAGSALCSRVGVSREIGYAAGLIGSSILLLGKVAGIWYLR